MKEKRQEEKTRDEASVLEASFGEDKKHKVELGEKIIIVDGEIFPIGRSKHKLFCYEIIEKIQSNYAVDWTEVDARVKKFGHYLPEPVKSAMMEIVAGLKIQQETCGSGVRVLTKNGKTLGAFHRYQLPLGAIVIDGQRFPVEGDELLQYCYDRMQDRKTGIYYSPNEVYDHLKDKKGQLPPPVLSLMHQMYSIDRVNDKA